MYHWHKQKERYLNNAILAVKWNMKHKKLDRIQIIYSLKYKLCKEFKDFLRLKINIPGWNCMLLCNPLYPLSQGLLPYISISNISTFLDTSLVMENGLN